MEEGNERGNIASWLSGDGRPCAVTLQLRRITRMCMRYRVDLCGIVRPNITYCNNSNITLPSSLFARRALDYHWIVAKGASVWLGFARWACLLSGFVLSIFSLYCKLHEM